MPLTSDVELSQQGLVVSARQLTNAAPIDVAINDASGNQLTGFNPAKPATATTTSHTGSATGAVQLLAANAARIKFTIYNNTNQAQFIAYSTGASTGSFTMKIAQNGFYESDTYDYAGAVSAIAAGNGNGTLLVTELTP